MENVADIVFLLQSSRRSERNGRPARRRKSLSARLPRNVSVLLLLRPLKPTMSKLLERQTRHKLRPLNLRPTLVVSVLNYLRSGTNPLTARCTVGTVLPVVWSTRMARWRTLPTTLTLLTHRVVRCINHVSSHTPFPCYFVRFTRIGKSCERKHIHETKKAVKNQALGFSFQFIFHSVSCVLFVQVGLSADRC